MSETVAAQDRNIPATLTLEGARAWAMAEAGGFYQRAPGYASPFATQLADALTDPVIAMLLVGIIREAITHDRQAQVARAQLEAEERQRAAGPPTNQQRASARTSWVGQRAALERAGASR